MVELISEVVVVAIIGSLAVPIVLALLARFGYFEPLEITLFGRSWRFAPAVTKIVRFGSNAVTGSSSQPQGMVAQAVTGVLTVAPLAGMPQKPDGVRTVGYSVVGFRDFDFAAS